MHKMLSRLASVVAAIAIAAAPFPAALAAVAPTLGTAESFAVLGASTVTNTGPTVVSGDLGLSPGTSITGFPPGTVVGGTIHATDAVASQAQSDALGAYNNLASQACNTTYGVPTDVGGLTLLPGVYCFSSSAQLTGTLTLDAQGDPSAVWVFKVGSTLVTASNSTVLLVNGAQSCKVFWQVGSSATLGTGTRFVGDILALTSVTVNTDATVSGSTLALNGAVTLDSNTVTTSACAASSTAPTLSKAFIPATSDAGIDSTLVITLTNSGNTVSSLTAPLTDTLPAGMTITGNPASSCGGTPTVTATTVTLTGGSIPAGGSCIVSVTVRATSGGTYINSLAAGALQTNNGSNVAPAIATLTVTPVPAVTLGKAFSPGTIAAGGNATLTITLSNGGSTAAALTSPFTDTLPSGLTVSGTPTTTCGGTATAGTSTVTLTGGSIPAIGSCALTVAVTAASAGNYVNSLAAGALQTSNGINAAPAIATLSVTGIVTQPTQPTLGKEFGPATIAAGGTSMLTITLSNAGTTASGLTSALTDTLPSGLTVSGTPTTTCGGTATATTTTVTLTGGSIPANGSCTLTVSVIASSGGNYINSLAAGALQTNNGSNEFPAVATLTVSPPSTVMVGKTFEPSMITAGDSSLITIILSNSGDTDAILTAPFTDTMPSGLTIVGDFPNSCGGTITYTSTSFTMTGGSIPARGSCTIGSGVPVTGPPGTYVNTIAIGALQTSNGSNAAPAIASLTVASLRAVPTVNKVFIPASIRKGRQSTLTITLRNTTGSAARLTTPLVDALPKGMVALGSASTTCGGTVKAKGFRVTLSGGSIPANGSCTVTATVYGLQKGSYTNVIPVGALRTNKGNNAAAANAMLIVNN